jgi:serine/threonine-protein kinase
MGAIYAARTRDGFELAVKVILESSEARRPEALRRFVREARVLTSIRSPYVVRVLDVDSDARREIPFIAMELLNGTDLEKLVKKWGALEPPALVRLFVQASQGLGAAHALGVVHRDVKPANIFLHELPSGEVVPKICDFGIAKRTVVSADEHTVELTRTGGMIGSPAYMSPEQAKSAKHVDARTDIWSLGISLWEGLSGRRPWEECSSVGEIIVAVCTRPVTLLQKVAPWIEPGLALAVHRCLEQEPAARYASLEELAAALEPFALQGDSLTRSMLVPVTQERRESVAAPVAVAASGPSDRSLMGHSSTLAAQTGTRRRPWLLIAAGGGAAVAVAAAAAVAVRFAGKTGAQASAAPARESVAVSAVATAPAPPPSMSAVVVVRPADAAVTVGGKPAELNDGGLVLRGQPGDSFQVVVAAGEGREQRSVVITKEGVAQPDLIEVAPAASASASVAARVPAAPPPRVAGKTAEPAKGRDKEKGAGEAAPPAPPPPTGVKAAEKW